MKVYKDRFVLTFFATLGLCLTVASTDAHAQTSQADRYSGSSFSTAAPMHRQTYTRPAIRPMVSAKPIYAGPVLSMSLPTAGPYQSGLQFGAGRRSAISSASFAASATPAPFPTLSEQVSRASANTLQSSPSYIGTSGRVTGQSLSKEVVRRSVVGTVGLSGVMGLTSAL